MEKWLVFLCMFYSVGGLAQQVEDARGKALRISADSVVTLLGRVIGMVGFADSSLINDARWKQVTNVTGDLFKDYDTRKVTLLEGDSLRVDVDGSYLILVNFSLVSPVGINRRWALGVSKNGTILVPYSGRGTSAGSPDLGNATVMTFCDAVAGDKLTFEYINLTDSQEIVPWAASFIVFRLLY
jgi:hypothetical protein